MITRLESETLDKLAEVSGLLHTIIMSGDNKEIAAHDWSEIALHIHALQNAILANGMARQLDGFRIMGSSNYEREE